MAASNQDIILHNYPQSPVAEKVRVALGIKGTSWHNVEIPRLPPKPLLLPLTGGYRRTPVMQIGADIFCDSQCIMRELDRRQPEPSLMPTAEAGLMGCLSLWTDGPLFDLAVKLVLGSAGENLPQDFAEDRGRLYLGEDWAAGLKRANAQLPHLVAQMRAPLSWLNEVLSDGRSYLLGAAASATDAQVYYTVWFVRGRWAGGAEFLSEFPHLERWERAVAELGHGRHSDLAPEVALDLAKASEPAGPKGVSPNDPQGLEVGLQVNVSPDVNGGEQPVGGTVRYADANTVCIERNDPQVGTVSVSFPRTNYRIDIA